MLTKTYKNELYTEYFENGQERVEKNYRDGRLHGKWTEWYANDKKELDENYINGQRDGKRTRTEWYENAKV